MIIPEIDKITFRDYKKELIFIFVKTSSACPVQYDIYTDESQIITHEEPKYYARLRWGHFYVSTEPLGEEIYMKDFDDDLKGFFEDTAEEIEYLQKSCAAIWKFEEKNNEEKIYDMS